MNYLTKEESETLINSTNTTRHKLLALFMLDGGLRVSETVSLTYGDFDFKKRILKVKSLKKREEQHIREIPLSNRLFECLAEYIGKQTEIKPKGYLFASPNDNSKPITRFAVYKYLLRLSRRKRFSIRLHPHALRHTFATHLLANDTPLENIKTLLGHKSYNTTLIYAHIPTDTLRKNINGITEKKRFLSSLFSPFIRKRATAININFAQDITTIGRNIELVQLAENANKHINTLILGNIGVGKSHLLQSFEQEYKGKLLKLDDLDNIKKTLGNILIYLYKNDKQAVYELIYGEFDLNKLQTRITKESVANLCDEIIKNTAKHEYLILIDSLDGITNKTVKVLEKLKDHFTLIGSARSISIDKGSFLWNFEVMKLQTLPRNEGLLLAKKLSAGLECEDIYVLMNHIYEQTNGNPRAIFELCDRYRKEPILSNQVIKSVKHTGAIPEIDVSIIVVVFLALLASLKYFTNETGNTALKSIGGIALIMLLLSRYFFAQTKRKLV